MYNDFTTGMAIGAHLSGLNNTEIASLLSQQPSLSDLNRRTIGLWVNDFKANGSVKRGTSTGRKDKLSIGDKKYLKILAKRNKFDTIKQLIVQSNLDVCHQTFTKFLRENDLYSCRIKFKPYLTKLNIKQRKQWYDLYKNWGIVDWGKVVFSDESAFLLKRQSKTGRVIREKGKGFHPFNVKPRFKTLGKKVHVWGCFSKSGVGPLVFLEENVTAYTYVELLDEHVIEYFDELERRHKSQFTFQQDNAPAHTADSVTGNQNEGREAIGWFEENGIPLLHHPGNSPDLNPIENLWDILDNELRKMPQTDSVEEFKERIKSLWYAIPKSICVSLISSMPKRIYELKENKYYGINY